jgi:hypothetical protein
MVGLDLPSGPSIREVTTLVAKQGTWRREVLQRTPSHNNFAPVRNIPEYASR